MAMKILIPTDFSKCADNAIAYGCSIAAQTGATVTLLHVLYPFEAVNNDVYQALWLEDYIKLRKDELKRLADELAKKTEFAHVKVEELVEIGFPVTQICKAAKDIKADLIIMGATGATDLATLFLGSNASGVLANTRIPVLTVPTKSKFHTLVTAVFPTDFNLNITEGSAKVLRDLLNTQSARLTILHINAEKGTQPNVMGEELLNEKLAYTNHYFHYVQAQDISLAVNEYIQTSGVGLLVSVSHDHGFLHRLFYESVSKNLAFRTHIPMLVLHDA
jgi:nucleotide-binding universal stress UspA family protein